MRKFGLIGFPLTHSFSKKYFEEKFTREKISGCTYDLFPLQKIEDLPGLIKSNPELRGLNVTIPYKEKVIPYLSNLSPEAAAIKAVNCIKINGEKTEGFNTDVYGFEVSFTGFIGTADLKPLSTSVFVLGTGGSSKAVEYVLKKMGLEYYVVSRSKGAGAISYNNIAGLMRANNIFINTTPVGMFPEVSTAPAIPYQKLGSSDFLFDLIYNPEETELLKRGAQAGSKTKNGLQMLQLQAEKSWEIWNG